MKERPTLGVKAGDGRAASAAASIATGWSEPVPGRELHPLKSSAFHGALLRQPDALPRTDRLHHVHGIASLTPFV
jgi:hypothetical protein